MASNHKAAFKRFSAKVNKRSLAVTQNIAVELSAKVIDRTPVLTGEARGNWEAALNTIPQGYSSSRLSPSGAESIGAAKDVAGQMRVGDTFALANSAPHIGALEDGSSRQAPSGMVGVTVAEFPRIVEEAVRRNAR